MIGTSTQNICGDLQFYDLTIDNPTTVAICSGDSIQMIDDICLIICTIYNVKSEKKY